MNDRTYRKFVRFNLRQRVDMLKVLYCYKTLLSLKVVCPHICSTIATNAKWPTPTLRFRVRTAVNGMLQAEEKARSQRGAERAAAVKAFRSEMSDRSSAAQEARRAAVQLWLDIVQLESASAAWPLAG